MLEPSEIAKPTAYRPAGKGKGLHAILGPARPWRHGKPIPLDGALRDSAVLLLWFRVDEAPLEGTELWDQSGTIAAPALAIALQGLSEGEHLVVTGRDGRGQYRVHLDLSASRLVRFLRTAFDWGFRAYVGPDTQARIAEASESARSFIRNRAGELARWTIVADECYDAGALEIWSRRLTAEQLAARVDLPSINRQLGISDPRPK